MSYQLNFGDLSGYFLEVFKVYNFEVSKNQDQ